MSCMSSMNLSQLFDVVCMYSDTIVHNELIEMLLYYFYVVDCAVFRDIFVVLPDIAWC